jgi:hypothetical protein
MPQASITPLFVDVGGLGIGVDQNPNPRRTRSTRESILNVRTEEALQHGTSVVMAWVYCSCAREL